MSQEKSDRNKIIYRLSHYKENTHSISQLAKLFNLTDRTVRQIIDREHIRERKAKKEAK